MTTERESLSALLRLDLSPIWQRLHHQELVALERAYRARHSEVEPLQLLRFLAQALVTEADTIYSQRRAFAGFNRRYSKAVTEPQRQQVLLAMATTLGATRWQLALDRRALKRWFGKDTLIERYWNRQAALERRLVLLLGRLGALAAELTRRQRVPWEALDIETSTRPLLAYDGDARVRIAAFSALATSLRALPQNEHEGRVDDATLRYLYRSALARGQETWIQTEALSLLLRISPERFATVLEHRLAAPAAGDDLFVRASAVRQLGGALTAHPQRAAQLTPLLTAAAADPSPFVRQRLVQTLAEAPTSIVTQYLPPRLLEDAEPSVRGAAAQLLTALHERPDLALAVQDWLAEALRSESDRFVLHLLIEVAALGETQAWRDAVLPALEQLHQGAESITVRRWAARAREQLWVRACPHRRERLADLAALVASITPGRQRRLPRRLRRDLSTEELGRMLALLAQADFPLELMRGPTGVFLRRGDRRGFRLWRLLHELWHPSPDKRQAFPHSTGRIYRGLLQAPSGGLDELAETKVPGEPLHIGEEDGWRPYLPLVDQAISSLDQGWPTRPLQLFTAEGVTELRPPSMPWSRLWARLWLNLRFTQYARRRNWRPSDRASADDYLAQLGRLGFRVRFQGHLGPDERPASADPQVERFFPALLPFTTDLWWERGREYFVSVYQNTLAQLALFIAAVGALFLADHLWRNRQLRRARKQIPLVIGGWGTRGKSGTERIKAAMINALGFGLVSKTTGCEAMFLYAPPFGRLREMFLFRPYDKATIWEQAFVVRLSARLRTEVFLWECMGLTPSYITILQQQWMRDDIATITNAYPDHEDLQGPAGINIPEVMVNFIPPRSRLLTSEEQMLPILREGARRAGTSLEAVGWREAGLLTPDILARFLYDEHPYNIALVLALARELDVQDDFALKEMADRVVPDLGVLKTYPDAWVEQRRLRFVMGMSANERFGALGNWSRIGFDRLERAEQPAVWITTVVNNRADRVPRSRVFAELIANDLSADSHLLIGGNLNGLVGYLHEAWATRMEGFSLWDTASDRAEAQRRWRALARWLRVPLSGDEVKARLQASLAGLGLTAELSLELAAQLSSEAIARTEAIPPSVADALCAFLERDLKAWRDFSALEQAITDGDDPAALERRAKQLAGNWFQAKLVVVDDYYASGDRVVLELARSAPPGLDVRVMGLQNIKGTGLDFVYRWQAWEQCAQLCRQIEDKDPAVAAQGLAELVRFQDYGLLCELRVREIVEQTRHALWAQREEVQAELELVRAHLEQALARVRATLSAQQSQGWSGRLAALLEGFFDAGDAVRRRKRADRIYRDLAAERISGERAALELQALTKRQKGGWLRFGAGGH